MSVDLTRRPSDDECYDYFRAYVAKVPDGNILETLEEQNATAVAWIRTVPDDQFQVVHPPYGWSIRTVLEHCCDAERVFSYRMLHFAAGDSIELPGWEQEHYATCGYGNAKTAGDLADEFDALRKSNLHLLKRLNPSGFDNIGTADGRKVSVRTLAWLMAGHWIHHEAILKERLKQSA